jgi:hypothetical protein
MPSLLEKARKAAASHHPQETDEECVPVPKTRKRRMSTYAPVVKEGKAALQEPVEICQPLDLPSFHRDRHDQLSVIEIVTELK